MKIKILNIILIASLFALPISLFANTGIVGSSSGASDFSKVGANGAQFLKIGVGARANGMGGAFGSVSDDLTALHWNPAGIAAVEGYNAEFSYNHWFAGWSHTFAAMSLPINENYKVAIGVVSFASEDIPITTLFEPDGTGSTYRVSDFAGIVSFSGYLTDQFSFGINGKVVSNAFTDISASTLAFDIGTMYATGFKDIKLGFSIHNLGGKMTLDGQPLITEINPNPDLNNSPREGKFTSYPYSMPLIFRASISAPLIDQPVHKLLGAFDFVTTSDSPEQFIGGLEYEWNDLFFIRGGYMFGHQQQNVAFGAGFKYLSGGFGGNIDYSINPTVDLGWIQRLSIAVNFGS